VSFLVPLVTLRNKSEKTCTSQVWLFRTRTFSPESDTFLCFLFWETSLRPRGFLSSLLRSEQKSVLVS